jgi:dihydrofolate reductase
MRKVIYSPLVSLDGYVEGPNRELDWVIVDKELHTYINDHQSAIDTFLFGRRMYEVMKSWDMVEQTASNPEYILDFARIWKNIHKIVFSKTLAQVQGNATLSTGDIVAEIARLKAEHGKDMSVGGAAIASSLMRSNLIDEYWLYVQPVILGSGTPMFPSLDNKINLRLLETRTFNSGVVLLRYQSVAAFANS